MNILAGLLKQDCVYWPPGTIDKFGQITPGNPIPLKCQWVNKKIVMTNPDGKTFEVTTQVNLSVAVEEEGWLWLGMYSQKPQTPSNETKIKLVTQYQDIDNVEKLWIAGI